jgi:NAD(P)-dependent dehydrogenase (short-subunit alcohol dehydrogenase family)
VTRLEGRTSVVTGGNAGLGLGMAMGIGQAGARVVIWARDQAKNERAVAELAGTGIDARAFQCDVSEPADVSRAMADTLSAVDAVDCLVANAGIAAAAPFLDTSLAEWQRVLRTNLDGTFLTTQAVARHMVARGHGGSMIIVSSLASRFGGGRQAAYTASKTGLIGLGRTLAVELARHRIRCNILIPGWTETAMNESLRQSESFVQATTKRTPVRRWAQPAEFGQIAAFLADPGLMFHTGNEIVVDGGYSLF